MDFILSLLICILTSYVYIYFFLSSLTRFCKYMFIHRSSSTTTRIVNFTFFFLFFECKSRPSQHFYTYIYDIHQSAYTRLHTEQANIFFFSLHLLVIFVFKNEYTEIEFRFRLKNRYVGIQLSLKLISIFNTPPFFFRRG